METPGRDQPDLDALTLGQGVDHHGGAVRAKADLPGRFRIYEVRHAAFEIGGQSAGRSPRAGTPSRRRFEGATGRETPPTSVAARYLAMVIKPPSWCCDAAQSQGASVFRKQDQVGAAAGVAPRDGGRRPPMTQIQGGRDAISLPLPESVKLSAAGHRQGKTRGRSGHCRDAFDRPFGSIRRHAGLSRLPRHTADALRASALPMSAPTSMYAC